MKKTQIIRKNHEFQDIIKKNDQTVSRYIVVYKKDNQRSLRIGISVSKKFANAVYRNLYRRQVRSCLDEIKLWNIKKDVVLILRLPFLTLPFNKKVIEIKKILERL